MSSHPVVSKHGAVTVEDGDDDEDFAMDEEYEKINRSASARGNNSNNGSNNGSNNRKVSAAASDDRSGLSPGELSAFEKYIHTYVNQPLLDHLVPFWLSPNTISYFNTGFCWIVFIFAYIAYKYEHIYPDMSMYLRIISGISVFISIVLDCLDGMQARKTGRTSKLGEVLDHSLDSANVPLCACAVVLTVFPDDFTILISIICGSLIYNAQLVIYRHVHIFVLPPLTGPAAQALAGGAMISFGLFFRYFNRHDYPVRVFLVIFYIVGNLAQLQNTFFYTKAILRTPGTIIPHLRFTATMLLHAILLLAGWVTQIEWLLSAIVIAYRCNGKYVLDTLQHFKVFTATHTKEQVRKEDTQWRWEVVGALLLMIVLALTSGIGEPYKQVEGGSPLDSVSWTGLPLVTDSLFHLVFYIFMIGCIALNIWDLKQAMPMLAAK